MKLRKVKRTFFDRNTKRINYAGNDYLTPNEEWAAYLEQEGYLEPPTDDDKDKGAADKPKTKAKGKAKADEKKE